MTEQPPTFDTLELGVEARAATVWLNRPDRANAMNAPMWSELQQCFEWIDTTDSVRVAVLAGRGKHFCAGIDLAMLRALHGDGERGRANERLRRKVLELQANLTAIEACRKPVLAAIHSTCYGGGLDMVSCCDMRYCTADAAFAIKEIDVGLTADVGSLQRLPYLIGEGLVRELAYTGRVMGGEEAHAVRLVNGVYGDRDALMRGVAAVAAEIAAKAPLAVRGTKATLAYGRDHGVGAALDYAATWNAAMLSFDDVGAALAARGQAAEFED